jgi:glutathione S-transferase
MAMTIDEPALTLYAHPLSSYCWKVLMALYEAGIPFRIERIDGRPRTHPQLSSFWPIGKMPLLYDEARDQAVPESTIIIQYLQDRRPGDSALLPQDAAARLDARLWDRFFDLYVQTPMQKLVSEQFRQAEDRDPVGGGEAHAMLDTAYAMLEERMGARTWVSGEAFTLADCAAMPALFYAEALHPFSGSHPAIARYLERIIKRPSARRVIGEARPHFQMFPFRDALNARFIPEA